MSADQPFIGEIYMGGWNFAPVGWAMCNGQLMAISQNTALFNLIGTTYGGDGVSTFALPDLRGRLPVHQGPGYVIGQFSGTESVTLTVNQIPAHSHLLNASTGDATQTGPAGHVTGDTTTSGAKLYGAPITPVALHASAIGSAGGALPHDNRMPFMAITFVIALEGIFPSQS